MMSYFSEINNKVTDLNYIKAHLNVNSIIPLDITLPYKVANLIFIYDRVIKFTNDDFSKFLGIYNNGLCSSSTIFHTIIILSFEQLPEIDCGLTHVHAGLRPYKRKYDNLKFPSTLLTYNDVIVPSIFTSNYSYLSLLSKCSLLDNFISFKYPYDNFNIPLNNYSGLKHNTIFNSTAQLLKCDRSVFHDDTNVNMQVDTLFNNLDIHSQNPDIITSVQPSDDIASSQDILTPDSMSFLLNLCKGKTRLLFKNMFCSYNIDLDTSKIDNMIENDIDINFPDFLLEFNKIRHNVIMLQENKKEKQSSVWFSFSIPNKIHHKDTALLEQGLFTYDFRKLDLFTLIDNVPINYRVISFIISNCILKNQWSDKFHLYPVIVKSDAKFFMKKKFNANSGCLVFFSEVEQNILLLTTIKFFDNILLMLSFIPSNSRFNHTANAEEIHQSYINIFQTYVKTLNTQTKKRYTLQTLFTSIPVSDNLDLKRDSGVYLINYANYLFFSLSQLIPECTDGTWNYAEDSFVSNMNLIKKMAILRVTYTDTIISYGLEHNKLNNL